VRCPTPAGASTGKRAGYARLPRPPCPAALSPSQLWLTDRVDRRVLRAPWVCCAPGDSHGVRFRDGAGTSWAAAMGGRCRELACLGTDGRPDRCGFRSGARGRWPLPPIHRDASACPGREVTPRLQDLLAHDRPVLGADPPPLAARHRRPIDPSSSTRLTSEPRQLFGLRPSVDLLVLRIAGIAEEQIGPVASAAQQVRVW
jgi:hypothetical protein